MRPLFVGARPRACPGRGESCIRPLVVQALACCALLVWYPEYNQLPPGSCPTSHQLSFRPGSVCRDGRNPPRGLIARAQTDGCVTFDCPLPPGDPSSQLFQLLVGTTGVFSRLVLLAPYPPTTSGQASMHCYHYITHSMHCHHRPRNGPVSYRNLMLSFLTWMVPLKCTRTTSPSPDPIARP